MTAASRPAAAPSPYSHPAGTAPHLLLSPAATTGQGVLAALQGSGHRGCSSSCSSGVVPRQLLCAAPAVGEDVLTARLHVALCQPHAPCRHRNARSGEPREASRLLQPPLGRACVGMQGAGSAALAQLGRALQVAPGHLRLNHDEFCQVPRLRASLSAHARFAALAWSASHSQRRRQRHQPAAQLSPAFDRQPVSVGRGVRGTVWLFSARKVGPKV